jgi:hypothetical protein
LLSWSFIAAPQVCCAPSTMNGMIQIAFMGNLFAELCSPPQKLKKDGRSHRGQERAWHSDRANF